MDNHTPGPWFIGAYTGDLGIRVQNALRIVAVIPERAIEDYDTIEDDRRFNDASEANARLIASAPTLFSFVQSLALAGNTKAKETLDLLGLLD